MAIIGRQHELGLIAAALGPGELVALTGVSGMGKTTIAQAFVQRSELASVAVDCFGLSARDAAAAVVAAADGVAGGAEGAELWVVAAEALNARGVELLLLDDIGFDFAELEILRRGWGGALLTTSHHTPDDGQVLPISPIEVEHADFRASDAFALFESSGQAEDLTFAVADGEVELVRRIAEFFAGHPLAICLAGRRAAITSVRTVLGLLEGGHDLSDADRPQRHQTHWAAVDFSWHALPLGEQRLLYVMALFARPLRIEALAEIAGESLDQTLERIRRLVRGGLVARGEFQQPLELFRTAALREFPQEQPDAAAQVVGRIIDVALSEARKVRPGLTRLLDFGEEPSFWRIAVERGCEGLDREDAGMILAAWFRYAAIRTGARGSIDVDVDALLERLDYSDAWLQAARCYTVIDLGRAERHGARAVSAAKTPREAHDARVFAALVLSQRYRVEEARELFDKTFDPQFDTPGTALIEAELRLLRGDKEGAHAALKRLDGMETSSLSEGTKHILLAWISEDPEVTDAHYRRALEIARSSKRILNYAYTLDTHALILGTVFDRFDEARDQLQRAREICEMMGAHHGVARSHIDEATVELLAGDYVAAERSSRIPSTEDAAQFASTADLVWAASLWHQGRLDELRPAWPAILAMHRGNERKYYESMWRTVDLGLAAPEDLDAALEQHMREGGEWAPLFESVAFVRRVTPQWSFAELLEAWPTIDAALGLPRSDPGVKQGLRFVEARLPEPLRRLVALREVQADVVALADYSAYRVGGQWYDLSREVGMRLLGALVEASAPIDHATLGELLYPGEFVTEDAMANRVNVQVSKLRSAGLKPFLVKRADGFALEGAVVVEQTAPPGHAPRR